MLVSVLASGSEGNSTYLKIGNKNILIDIGMNNKYIATKLGELGVETKDIDYVFITHPHTDHTGAMKVFFKKNTPFVFVDEKMMVELPFLEDYPNLCFDSKEMDFGDFKVEPFRTSHDAPGSRGYIFKEGDKSFVYVTDTGYINHKLFDKLSNHDLYVFESNHDVEMLMHGPYPPWLKKRIRGDEGHLSNNQCGFYLSKFIGPKTKEIALAHLSHENNSPELAMKTVKNELEENGIEFNNIIIAKQRERTDLIKL